MVILWEKYLQIIQFFLNSLDRKILSIKVQKNIIIYLRLVKLDLGKKKINFLPGTKSIINKVKNKLKTKF